MHELWEVIFTQHSLSPLFDIFCCCAEMAEMNVALVQLVYENEANLKDKFGALLLHARKQLENRVSANDFGTYASALVPDIILKNPKNVCEIFDAITSRGVWNYKMYSSLVRTMRQFEIADEKLQEYNQLLSHYYITTKIQSLIEKKKLDQKNPPELPDPLPTNDFHKLSVKLKPHNVTEKSLQYLQDLWKEIADRCFQLPNLDAVLYDIQEGCVLVTWLIPNTIDAASKIRSTVHICEDFFTKKEIVELMVNEECIYPDQKVRT